MSKNSELKRQPAILVVVLICVSPIYAQSNIDTVAQSSWAENAGWMNWRDASGFADGVRVEAYVLKGYIWGENIGWLHVGDGVPAAPPLYANLNDTDYGVTVASDGSLIGYAWGENVGWVNFDGGALATPADPARIECDGRLNGYAWSENLGWINLSLLEPGHFVAIEPSAIPTTCDVNDDGLTNGLDIDGMVSGILANEESWRNVCAGDLFPVPDGDGILTIDDIPPFVECLLMM